MDFTAGLEHLYNRLYYHPYLAHEETGSERLGNSMKEAGFG